MEIAPPAIDSPALSQLIAEAKASGGSERANYQLFITGLCRALGLPQPAMSSEQNQRNDYVFERRVDFKHPDGSTTAGFIDCYLRSHFVLEAKQSAKRQSAPDPNQLSLLPEDAVQKKRGTAIRGTGGWDRAMLAARNQAEGYARALPVEHGYPPFLLVLDVGHVLEVYADFSGQGKNYAHFPDRQSYRLSMDDLLLPDVQQRLHAIWTEPLSLDPAKRSAEVTRDIAGRLSIIAKRLETRHDARDVAEFLMRCLFTMFAEDVGLLPDAGFAALLKDLSDKPETFPVALESLWKTMDEGGYEPRLMTTLKRFNGSLFKSRRALPLAPEDIHELHVAAVQDWSDVEPAIFGTLLERALDPRERSKLGAHYTPRAYVERLVIPTIIEPLRADWDEVQVHVADLKREGKDAEALQAVKDFHHKLCTTRVLDPACGSGNFLYVSLELMKKLEGEVLVALDELGEDQSRLAMEGETVGPRQFYGLEINPRAVPIADLVLWIGFLKWQLRTVGLKGITEPVLNAYGNIRHQDAILAYDRVELLRDEQGKPFTRWDGVSMKPHPVTGELVPDPAGQVEVYRYINPRPAEWPEAEFIVGNPPFHGARTARRVIDSGYLEAVRRIHPELPANVDQVMYWWWRAANLVRDGSARQFGLVTTNSIKQAFSRRVVAQSLSISRPISLKFAVPDHPWSDDTDAASVDVALTVVVAGAVDGTLWKLPSRYQWDVGSDDFTKSRGRISAALRLTADVSAATALAAGSGLSSVGYQLTGTGFNVDPASRFDLPTAIGESPRQAPLMSARDITQKSRGLEALDCCSVSEPELEARFPAVYQWLLTRVKPERDTNQREAVRLRWWVYGEPRFTFRPALLGLNAVVVTPLTSKHRIFVRAPMDTIFDSTTVAFALEESRYTAILTSRPHVVWSLAAGGTLEDRPRYNKAAAFDPFPFPDSYAANLRLVAHLDALGERLDAFRKERLAAHDFLTMTSLYNVMERLRELENGASVEPLSEKEKAIHEAGLVSVLKEIHDDIDRAVFEAYGWADLIPALVGKPGATLPSPHKSSEQEAAEEELLTRLVALNKERAAEEARGLVRWLRPEYQIPRLGRKVAAPEGEQVEADIAEAAKVERPKWPADAFEQIRQVRDVLARAPAPMPVEGIATSFEGRLTEKRRARIGQVLDTLVATGAARTDEAGAGYFVPR